MRDWLVEGGAIPDDDDLASDLSSPKIRYRANNDWILESKTDMRARGVRSPDLADAVALTFTVQEFFNEWSKPKNEGEFGSWDIDTELDRMGELDNSPTAWMA
jgi:hypothetical protein